jgi:hypothetical protein
MNRKEWKSHEDDIHANKIECLVNHFGKEPVLLLKAFTCEEFWKEGSVGYFWANSIESFRNNTEPGRGDPWESIVPLLQYGINSDFINPPNPKDMQAVYPRITQDVCRQASEAYSQCSIICFYGIHLEDCVVGKMRNSEINGEIIADNGDCLFVKVEKHLNDFGKYICFYDFKSFNNAFDKIKTEYPLAEFDRVKYLVEPDNAKGIPEFINNYKERLCRPFRQRRDE